MIKLKKWAQDKPPEVALLSITLASSATALFEMIRAFRGSILLKDAKLPKTEEWTKLYTDHRRIFNTTKEMLDLMGGFPKVVSDFDDSLIDILDQVHPFAESGSIPDEIKDTAQQLLTDGLQNILEDAINQAIEETSNIDDLDLSGGEDCPPELIFGLSISLPCWMIYGQHPVILLRKARLGNIEDIEKLFRIDPSVMFDKKVKEHFHNILHGKKESKKLLLLEALDKKPKKTPNIRMTKNSIAGLISIKTERLSHRLDQTEIRSLFDALSQDRGQGLIDADLPYSPESFKKAIQRHRKFWSPIA